MADLAQALSVVRSAREKLRVLDQVGDTLEAVVGAEIEQKQAEEALLKVRDAIKKEQRELEVLSTNVVKMRRVASDEQAEAEEAHKVRLADMEAEAVRVRKELEDKHDSLVALYAAREKEANKKAEDAETVLVAVLEELEVAKTAHKKFLETIGVK